MSRPSLADWLVRLESVTKDEMMLGLERVSTVLSRLPSERPGTVLHIAGTNGKGSTVAMLDALFRGANFSTGCYTSPHLVHYNERILVDGTPASDDEIVTAFETIEAARGDIPLTYFEFGTLAALLVFLARGVDVALFEIGLGGRLDAVNAIEPDGGVITSIALDHQGWLGDTLEAIGREKAGILRLGKPFVYSAPARPVSIDETAGSTGARLLAAGRDFEALRNDDSWDFVGVERRLDGLDLPALPGDFQVDNAAGALALLEATGFDALLTTDGINAAIGTVALMGRSAIIVDEAERRWRFDVAHNPAAAEALASIIDSEPRRHRVAITGMLGDKDVEGVVSVLAPRVDQWIALAPESDRAIPAAELARRIANTTNRHCRIAAGLDEAIAAALDAPADAEILVVGSFSTVGPVLERLRIEPFGPATRGL